MKIETAPARASFHKESLGTGRTRGIRPEPESWAPRAFIEYTYFRNSVVNGSTHGASAHLKDHTCFGASLRTLNAQREWIANTIGLLEKAADAGASVRFLYHPVTPIRTDKSLILTPEQAGRYAKLLAKDFDVEGVKCPQRSGGIHFWESANVQWRTELSEFTVRANVFNTIPRQMRTDSNIARIFIVASQSNASVRVYWKVDQQPEEYNKAEVRVIAAKFLAGLHHRDALSLQYYHAPSVRCEIKTDGSREWREPPVTNGVKGSHHSLAQLPTIDWTRWMGVATKP